MNIIIPKEYFPGEKRVAATPDIVRKYIDLGFTVSLEAGAGAAANLVNPNLTGFKQGAFAERLTTDQVRAGSY